MPEGICTVDSSASNPSSVDDLTGTPMTGKSVFAAMAPARCAALPAAAMIAPKPSACAERANAAHASGVRCADRIRTSTGISSDLSFSTAFLIVPRSLSLPITIATFFIETPPIALLARPGTLLLSHTDRI